MALTQREDKDSMKWTLSETIGLAKARCKECHGCGMHLTRGGRMTACNCVYRAIFRACYRRFTECAHQEASPVSATLEPCYGPENRHSYSMKSEEYLADFTLIAKRTLTEDDYRLFRFHYLLGADWKLCCARLNMGRGNYFHSLYRIQQTLGKTFRDLRPYSLFPLDEYFGTAPHRKPVARETSRPRRMSLIA